MVNLARLWCSSLVSWSHQPPSHAWLVFSNYPWKERDFSRITGAHDTRLCGCVVRLSISVHFRQRIHITVWVETVTMRAFCCLRPLRLHSNYSILASPQSWGMLGLIQLHFWRAERGDCFHWNFTVVRKNRNEPESNQQKSTGFDDNSNYQLHCQSRNSGRTDTDD